MLPHYLDIFKDDQRITRVQCSSAIDAALKAWEIKEALASVPGIAVKAMPQASNAPSSTAPTAGYNLPVEFRA